MKGLARLLLMALVALAGLVPVSAGAHAVAVAGTCRAGADFGESFADLAARPERWRCAVGGYDIGPETVFIRYRLMPTDAAGRAASFVTRAAAMERLDIAVIDRGGATRSVSIPADQARHLDGGPLMSVPLPRVTAESEWVVVRLVRPWSKSSIADARLDTAPEGTGWGLGQIVAMATICGMLLVPLLLNGGFYAILRRSYVLWHIVLIFAMLMQTLIGTGFIHLLADPPTFVEGAIANLSYAAMGASALMFSASFIETGCLGRRVQVALRIAAAAVMGAGLFGAVPLNVLRPWSTQVIYLAMALTIVMILVGMADAWRRGSRLVWYQVGGWTPTILVGAWRVSSYLLPWSHPTDSIVPFELAMAVEVIVSSIGIMTRLVALRRERDSANALVRELEGEARRDPLTGLWNRHAIDRRFEQLMRDGFRTMAVIDLDHFKMVNDRHGHAVGDEVLKVAAAALSSDADSRAVRMGGEEFLLLLRGPDAVDRAERCRRAVTTRVAADVPGLDRVVTASMGLVERERAGKLETDFATLYRQCDRLLYEAKQAGRNRMMRERWTGFGPSPARVSASGQKRRGQNRRNAG